MRITFDNKADREKAERYLKSTIDDLNRFLIKDCSEETREEYCNYGLSFDVIEDEETGELSYLRYQLSWGGPSDEIRFYPDGLIEYVYMDWFVGIGFDVSCVKEFQALKSDLGGMTMFEVAQ